MSSTWRPGRAAARAVLVLVATAVLAGCATYTDRLRNASLATSAGDYESAVSVMNAVLGVSSSAELPKKWGGDYPLAVLDRAVLQQSLRQFRESSRDLSAAEQELEVLDLGTDPVGVLGRYIYSDSAGPYRAPPSERLAVNGINLLNYLAVGDLDGAAVEARRFQVIREYMQSEGIEAGAQATLGTYLSGFVFEKRGEGDRALRYYEETLQQRPLDSLAHPVHRLAGLNPYRGPLINHILEQRPQGSDANGSGGELLIVLLLGRVPYKVPERMPAGVAVGVAGTYASGNTDWLKYGATKVIVYPKLVPAPSSARNALVRVDEREVRVEELIDFESLVLQEYEKIKPMIIAAALTRLASRAAVAEGVRAAGKQNSNALGDLLSILIESALVALDRPDTRSWTMLPARVLVARIPVAPGVHSVKVSFDGIGITRRAEVELAHQGSAAVVLTEPR